MTERLQIIIDKIQDCFEENNTKEFYFREQVAMSKCLPFIKKEYIIKGYEDIISQIIDEFSKPFAEVNFDKMIELHTQVKNSDDFQKNIGKREFFIIRVLLFATLDYEKENDDCYIFQYLEFFVDEILSMVSKESDIYDVIYGEFLDILG